MSEPRNRNISIDDSGIFGDSDFDPDAFLDTMDDELTWHSSNGSRPAWQRLADYYEWRRMREQLADWEDWELD